MVRFLAYKVRSQWKLLLAVSLIQGIVTLVFPPIAPVTGIFAGILLVGGFADGDAPLALWYDLAFIVVLFLVSLSMILVYIAGCALAPSPSLGFALRSCTAYAFRAVIWLNLFALGISGVPVWIMTRIGTWLQVRRYRRFASDAVLDALLLTHWRAHGRHEALLYAIKHSGNIAALEAAIRKREELILSEAASGPRSANPVAGRRVYRNAYIEGLREAIDIIKRAQEGAGE